MYRDARLNRLPTTDQTIVEWPSPSDRVATNTPLLQLLALHERVDL